MTSLRVMTYSVGGFRGEDGRVDAERVAAVIAEAGPDLVALQRAGSDTALHGRVAARLGMTLYGSADSLLLSSYPVRGTCDFDLGGGGRCQRADLDVGGRRLHLFNLTLSGGWLERRRQTHRLLGPELLGAPGLPCPLLLLGDFSCSCWRLQCFGLALDLRSVPRPWHGGTYPAARPCSGPDRAYLRGGVQAERGSVHATALARVAAPHLPFTFRLHLEDPRNYLRVDARRDFRRGRMEIAPG